MCCRKLFVGSKQEKIVCTENEISLKVCCTRSLFTRRTKNVNKRKNELENK